MAPCFDQPCHGMGEPGCRVYDVVRRANTGGTMLSGKRSAPWCGRCGTVARFIGDMSHIGICEECSEWALVDNLRGMVDKQSVPYKRWLVAHQMSNMGRPKKYTPTGPELDALYSVYPKKVPTDTP